MIESIDPGRWSELSERALAGELIAREQAARVLEAGESELWPLLAAAFAVRRAAFGQSGVQMLPCCAEWLTTNFLFVF